MDLSLLAHLGTFFLALAGVWLASGLLVSAIDRLSARFGKGKFFLAFLLLGFMTSLSEASVAVNATLQGTPETSLGNLVGASLVLLLFLAPVLALSGNGIRMNRDGSFPHLLPALLVIFLPAPFLLNGSIGAVEGGVLIVAYALLLLRIYRRDRAHPPAPHKPPKTPFLRDAFLLALAAGVIFLSGRWLVAESVYFSARLGIETTVFGMLALSIGTNVPELAVGVRSVFGKKKTIAFANYVGSAAFNTLIVGFLAIANAPIVFEAEAFQGAAVVLAFGLTLFYLLARTKKTLSRFEAAFLLLLYLAFLYWQAMHA